MVAKALALGVQSGRSGGRTRPRTPAASMASRLARGLVGRPVVAEDAGVGQQGRSQALCARGQAGGPGHRPVAGQGGDHAGAREAGDQGGGLPVALGDGRVAPRALGSAPIHAGRLGRGPACVDAEQARGGERELGFAPGRPQGGLFCASCRTLEDPVPHAGRRPRANRRLSAWPRSPDGAGRAPPRPTP